MVRIVVAVLPPPLNSIQPMNRKSERNASFRNSPGSADRSGNGAGTKWQSIPAEFLITLKIEGKLSVVGSDADHCG